MAKFKVGDKVIVNGGEQGIVKGREMTKVDGDDKRIKITYIVRTVDANGDAKWASYDKKELSPYPQNVKQSEEYVKVYDVVDGYKITLYGNVRRIKYWNNNKLSIGYSIYSPKDEFNEKQGVKIARHRSRTSPFCQMYSEFNGEFNSLTVNNIMDAKADYIKNNFDKFINKRFNKKSDK